MMDSNQSETLAPRVYKLEGEVNHLAISVENTNKLVVDLGAKIDNLSSRGRVQPSIIISTGALLVGIIATLSAFVVYTNSASLEPVEVRVNMLEQSVDTNERLIIELLQRTASNAFNK
jgi:cell division protein FtsL